VDERCRSGLQQITKDWAIDFLFAPMAAKPPRPDETLGRPVETCSGSAIAASGGRDGVILALPPQQGGETAHGIFNADGKARRRCAATASGVSGPLPRPTAMATLRARWQVETLAGRVSARNCSADGQRGVRYGRALSAIASRRVQRALLAGRRPAEARSGGEPLPLRRWGMGIPPNLVIPGGRR